MINKLMPDAPIGIQMTAAEYERHMEEFRPLMAAAIAKWKADNVRKSKTRKKVSK